MIMIGSYDKEHFCFIASICAVGNLSPVVLDISRELYSST